MNSVDMVQALNDIGVIEYRSEHGEFNQIWEASWADLKKLYELHFPEH